MTCVPTHLKVIRFLRPDPVLDDPINSYCKVDYAHHDNLYGISVVYDIDYNERVVQAKWSICNGDNFNKDLGRRLAEKSQVFVEFNLDEMIEDELSLNEMLICVLLEKVDEMFWPECFEDTLNLFLKVTRKLKK